MALMFLLILWKCTFFIQGVSSWCNITCSTDYDTSLNCSCAGGSVLTDTVLVNVSCSGSDGGVADSCQIKPPQSWCMMVPVDFSHVTDIGTKCFATVSRPGSQIISEESNWELSMVVKPLPPYHVHVTNTDGLYNITWDNDNGEDCFIYGVRIRESKNLSKDPVFSDLVDQKYTLLNHKKLQPLTSYTVDVQAKFCPENLYQGPWSEWSSPAEWTTSGTSATGGKRGINVWRIFMLQVLILATVFILGYS